MSVNREWNIPLLSMLVLILSVLGLSACNQNNHERAVRQTVEEIKTGPSKPVEPLPPVEPAKQVHYTAENLRNPFSRPRQERALGDQPDLTRQKEPLEAFALDSLKMVGTLTEDGKIWALIAAPDGTIYPATLGNYIGQNFGIIENVTPNSIEITETIQVGGEWRKREATLAMAE